METKDYSTMLSKDTKKVISANFLAALNNGDLNKTIGGRTGGAINLGERFKLIGTDYIKDRWLPAKRRDDFASDSLYNDYLEEFNKAVKDEDAEYLKENGVPRSWAVFKTDRGDLSFTNVMGDEVSTAELWKNVETKSEDFDFEDVFVPSTRNVADFTVADFDGLIGKTIECIGIANDVPKGRFKINLRAWKVVG